MLSETFGIVGSCRNNACAGVGNDGRRVGEICPSGEMVGSCKNSGRSGNGGSDGNSARKEVGASKATEIAGAAEGTELERRGSLRIKRGARRKRMRWIRLLSKLRRL
jgi:hypothetical protein